MNKINKILAIVAISLAFMLAGCTEPSGSLELPTIFSDNMVLQQNENVNIWGKSAAKSTVKIETSWGQVVETQADNSGEWKTTIPTVGAGGPYNINIKSGNQEISIDNVMLGEVWLASGQSNMEMSLDGWPPTDLVENSERHIAESENSNIRMFTVVKATSITPKDDATGEWQMASPETTGGFSATAYFFAKKIYEELNIPVGIIHTSWGGTPIEAWISGEKLETDQDYSEIAEKLKEQRKQQAVYDKWLDSLDSKEVYTNHLNPHPFKGLDVFDSYFTNQNLDFSNWESIDLPNMIENSAIGEFDGVVWFKKEVVIPSSWDGKDLVLSLGEIDDMDVVYLNGEIVGATEEEGFWQTKRFYNIPADKFVSGKAIFTIKLIDTQGGGGFSGQSKELALYLEEDNSEKLSLAGEWKYQVAAELAGRTLYLFNPENNDYNNRPELEISLSSHTPTVLYNAMIAPVVPYNLKGFIWYQGETNVGRANQYMRLKKLLIDDWREKFNNDDASFYYVQLAPWHYNDINGSSSANLRDAQRRSISENKNSGMAVTLDIGNNDNIHPGKKQEVGERLALWALKDKYEKDIVYSGPLYKEKNISKNKITITFVCSNNGLVINKDVPNQFEIAGVDNVYYPANVEVIGEDLIRVHSTKVDEPKNVRYAYKNGAVASLFNGEGLPAPSFTTEEEIDN